MTHRDQTSMAECAIISIITAVVLYVATTHGETLARMWLNYSPLGLEIRKTRALEEIARQGR